LPKLKGPAPIQKSIQKNKKKTGISILKITPQIDNGDIYNQIKIKILTRDHHSYFLNRSSKIIKIIIKKIIPLIIENRIKKKYQKIKNSTYANFIKKQNGNICWNSYSKLILKKIQALSLWPKNFTFYKNKKILLFLKNTYISKYKYRKIPGLLLIQKNKLIISTKDSSIYFTKIQLESKKKINISNFINGYVIKNNNILLNYKK
jgi:methionyl-tRNA formyltransferase